MIEKFPVLGTILSHGYLACGILQLRLAFPVLASSLLGPSVKISDGIMVESFVDYLVCYEGEILNEAFDTARKVGPGTPFSPALLTKLTNLSRSGCRELPKPENLKRLITEISCHEFAVKAVGVVYTMNSGVPQQHQPF